MITQILYLIFFTVSTVLAFRVAISEKMILERFGRWAEYQVEKGNKIWDLFICPWCANTLFIFFGWACIFTLEILPFEFNIKYVVVHCISWFASCFISGVTWTWYLTLNAKKEYYENITQEQ